MTRRLEELDRLDLRSRSAQEVLWPGGDSPHQDPRSWSPPIAPPRPEPRRSGGWRLRSIRWGTVVILAVLVVTLAGPARLVDLLADVVPVGSEELVDTPLPAGSDESSGSRLLPAVVVADVPPADTFGWMRTQGTGAGPVTFDPCRPIHYVTRSTGPATDDVAAIRAAVTIVSKASGLRFVYDGPTTEKPTKGRAAQQPARYGAHWAPVLVGWTSTAESPELDDNAGLGGGTPWRGPSGRLSYVSGTVWLDAVSLAPLLDSRVGRQQVTAVVVHELTHVLGATHPSAGDQLMSENGGGRTGLADGDRYALSVLGQGPCEPGLSPDS